MHCIAKVSEVVSVLWMHILQLTVTNCYNVVKLFQLRLQAFFYYYGPNWDVDESVKLLRSCSWCCFFSQEIQPSLEELALDTYGRKVLMYLLDPRSPAHFHPKVVELLKKGDGNSIRYRQSRDCTSNKIRPPSLSGF